MLFYQNIQVKTLEDVIGRRSLSIAVLVLKVSKEPCQGPGASSNLVHCSSTPKWLRLINAILIVLQRNKVGVYECFDLGSKLFERALESVEDGLG